MACTVILLPPHRNLNLPSIFKLVPYHKVLSMFTCLESIFGASFTWPKAGTANKINRAKNSVFIALLFMSKCQIIVQQQIPTLARLCEMTSVAVKGSFICANSGCHNSTHRTRTITVWFHKVESIVRDFVNIWLQVLESSTQLHLSCFQWFIMTFPVVPVHSISIRCMLSIQVQSIQIRPMTGAVPPCALVVHCTISLKSVLISVFSGESFPIVHVCYERITWNGMTSKQ